MEAFIYSDASHRLQLMEWEQAYPSLAAGFTLRSGGQSKAPYASNNFGLHVGDEPADVIANRRTLCEQIGMSFKMFTCANQVHGNEVVQVTATRGGAGSTDSVETIGDVDGMHTNEAGVLLASFYADCVPLYFLDPQTRAIGLAHAGWKGTVARISAKMLNAMQQAYGSEVDDIRVAIGPSIGGCCYEVDERIIEQVRHASPQWQRSVTAVGNGKYMLDLRTLNELIVIESGVLPKHIVRTNWCTSCRTDLFFSHRKEAGKTGRMASYIGWK